MADDRSAGQAREGLEFGEPGSGARRTMMAGERTFLAWWRTGLTALAVSIAVGRVVPAVAGGPRLAYTLDGILFAVLGVFILIYARARARDVDEMVARGEYRPPDDRVLGLMTGLAAIGGLVIGVLVAVGR